ncbi:unnamed protein product, partial [marine sediment metagenome]
IKKKKVKIGKNLKNIYQITSKGRERYNEISITQEERFNYPPKKILSKRNYHHWILWMTF